MISRKRFHNFFYIFCNGLTNFTILAKPKNENEYKFRNILQLFLLFLLRTEKGIGIVLCKKVKKTRNNIIIPMQIGIFF